MRTVRNCDWSAVAAPLLPMHRPWKAKETWSQWKVSGTPLSYPLSHLERYFWANHPWPFVNDHHYFFGIALEIDSRETFGDRRIRAISRGNIAAVFRRSLFSSTVVWGWPAGRNPTLNCVSTLVTPRTRSQRGINLVCVVSKSTAGVKLSSAAKTNQNVKVCSGFKIKKVKLWWLYVAYLCYMVVFLYVVC